MQDSGVSSTQSSTESAEKSENIQAENIESFQTESIENKKVSKMKVSSFQSEIQDVRLKAKNERKVETYEQMDIESFVKTLDVSVLKGQTRNWYRRRMNTAENMAKWKAAKGRFESLGFKVIQKSNTTISFEMKSDK